MNLFCNFFEVFRLFYNVFDLNDIYQLKILCYCYSHKIVGPQTILTSHEKQFINIVKVDPFLSILSIALKSILRNNLEHLLFGIENWIFLRINESAWSITLLSCFWHALAIIIDAFSSFNWFQSLVNMLEAWHMKKGLIVFSVDRDDYKVHRIKIENWIVDIQQQ